VNSAYRPLHSPAPSNTPTVAGGQAQEATEDPQEPQEERRGWFRRFFGL
jgi:hypothetical protein